MWHLKSLAQRYETELYGHEHHHHLKYGFDNWAVPECWMHFELERNK